MQRRCPSGYCNPRPAPCSSHATSTCQPSPCTRASLYPRFNASTTARASQARLLHGLVWVLLCLLAVSVASSSTPTEALDPHSCSATAPTPPGSSGTCTPPSAPITHTNPDEADYVIVGGGTAGCVLAARLCAALPHRTFTLLERGAPRPAASELRVRAMRHAFTAWKDPALTQTWLSQPNPGLGGREVNVLTGQTLGGSSAIAGGQWMKPPLSTFDSAAWEFDGAPCAAHAHALRLPGSRECNGSPVVCVRDGIG